MLHDSTDMTPAFRRAEAEVPSAAVLQKRISGFIEAYSAKPRRSARRTLLFILGVGTFYWVSVAWICWLIFR